MNSRWKKVWADFWSNKTRTFLIILTILLGTFAVGFNSSLQLYTAESMDSDFLSANPPEAWIFAPAMDDKTVRIAGEVPGVAAVEGRSVFDSRVIRPDGQLAAIEFIAVRDLSGLTTSTVQPVKGQSVIPPLGKHEVLIEASAASLGYQPGDHIVIERTGGRTRELRLAGYVHAPAEFPYSLGSITAYVTPETMEWLGGTLDYNQLAVHVAGNSTDYDHILQVVRAVEERLARGGVTGHGHLIYSPPGHHLLYGNARSVFLVMEVLGWLAALLSVFLIVNTTTGLMSQQTRQIGIMKATGGSTLQILGMYVVLVLGFGLAALVVALPLANAAAYLIGSGLAGFLGIYSSPYRLYPAALIQQVLAALMVPLLAALWPIASSVRMTVREALTDYGISRSEARKKTAVSRGSLLLPRPVRLSLRNAFRRKARLVLTLFTLVLAGAIFISIFNLWASLDSMVEDLLGYFMGDITVNFSRSYRLDEVAGLAKTVPDVESVEGWLAYGGTLVDRQGRTESEVYFTAPPSTSTLIRPIVIAGRWLQPGDENAIIVGNDFMSKFPEVEVGDWLTIRIDDKESDWQVVGVFSMIASQTPILYTNYEYLSHVMNQPGQVYSLQVNTSRHDMATQQKVRDELQQLYAAHGIRVSSADLGMELYQAATVIFDAFVYVFLAMAALIALVGGLGLMSTMSINVLERTREIGVLRAVGATNRDVQSIVLVEGMVVGLVSWLISLLLSLPITAMMTTGVGMILFSSPLQTVYGLTGMTAWLIGMLVMAILASALPARSASRLTIKDTLAYE